MSNRDASTLSPDPKGKAVTDNTPGTPGVSKHADNSFMGNTGGSRIGSTVKIPRISLDIAAKYSQRKSEPVRLEQVSEAMLPDISIVLAEIAAAMELSIDDADDITNLLNAITVDVYVNAYSDKKPFTGPIILPNGFRLDKSILGKIVREHCGDNPRRFARSFAKTAIEVMKTSPDLFRDLHQKRADEFNTTPAEAIYLFDGATGAVIGRQAELRLASIKATKLANCDRATSSNATSKGAAISYSLNDDNSTTFNHA